MAYELLICTRKGLLIGRSNADRSRWELSAPHFLGQQVDFARRDRRDGRVWVSTAHMPWGPHLFYSDDDGERWIESEAPRFEGETFAASPYELASRQELTWDSTKDEWSPRHELAASLDRIWTIVPGPASEPDQILLGVSPAGIFRSQDRGLSWELNRALWDHPTRGQWTMAVTGISENVYGSPPACDHIQIDSADTQHLLAVVQSAGVFETSDGGASWQPRNAGIRSDFLPEGGAACEASHDIHSFAVHPLDRQWMYAQHHNGVFASSDGGGSWSEIDAQLGAALGQPELTSLHGFASTIDPQNPDDFYVVPQISDEARVPVDGKLRVCRTSDGGTSWEALGQGLPNDFYQGAYRQALTNDDHPQTGGLGLYLGTNGGYVFASADGGDSWSELVRALAPVTALTCVKLG